MLPERYQILDNALKRRYIQILDLLKWPVDADQSKAFLVAIDFLYLRNVVPLLLNTKDHDRLLGLALLCAYYFTDETFEIPFADKCTQVADLVEKTRSRWSASSTGVQLHTVILLDGNRYIEQLGEMVYAQLKFERRELSLAALFGQFKLVIDQETARNKR